MPHETEFEEYIEDDIYESCKIEADGSPMSANDRYVDQNGFNLMESLRPSTIMPKVSLT